MTAMVVVLIPPAVEPGLPPMNMSTIVKSLLSGVSAAVSTVLKPAVLAVTEPNNDANTAPGVSMPAMVLLFSKIYISSEVIKKAGMVLIINLVLGLTAVIAILATSNMEMDDVLFEVYSAISTVGMTTGITRDLNTVGRIIIIIMMYCGRIGSMTFVLSFVHRPDKANIELPEEKVIIG